METFAQSIKELENKIKQELLSIEKFGGSKYFDFEDSRDGEIIKIRVSDHSANISYCTRSGANDQKMISFCLNWNKQKCNSKNEYIVDSTGYSENYGYDLINILEFELS